MVETTIQIPFAVRLDVDSHGAAYVAHDNVSGYVYGSNGTAKAKLRKLLTEQVEEGLQTAKNCDGLAIACSDGSVFVCRYKLGGWGYHIARQGNPYAGSSSGFKTFEECCETARKHAQQNGGVLWESCI